MTNIVIEILCDSMPNQPGFWIKPKTRRDLHVAWSFIKTHIWTTILFKVENIHIKWHRNKQKFTNKPSSF